MRIDFDELLLDPLLDVDRGVYLDADALPLSATSKRRLRELQQRWGVANERYAADEAADEVADARFDADVKDVELRVRRELAGTCWSLVRTTRRRNSGGGPR